MLLIEPKTQFNCCEQCTSFNSISFRSSRSCSALMSPAATATGASYGWSSDGGAGTSPIISSIVERLWSVAAMSSLSTNFTDLGSSASTASLSYVVDVVVGAADLCAFFFFYTFEMRKISHTTEANPRIIILSRTIQLNPHGWIGKKGAREMMNQLYPFRPFRLRSFQVAS